jgi:hypothetical protein
MGCHSINYIDASSLRCSATHLRNYSRFLRALISIQQTRGMDLIDGKA